MQYTPCTLSFVHRYDANVSEHIVVLLSADTDILAPEIAEHLPESFRAEISSRIARQPRKSFTLHTHATPFPKLKNISVLYAPERESLSETLAKCLAKIDVGTMLVLPDSVARDTAYLQIAVDTLALGNYRYQTYVTKPKDRRVSLFTGNLGRRAVSGLRSRMGLYQSVYLARDLVNTPSSRKYPERLAEYVMALPWKHTRIRVFDGAELETMGCELICAVGAGSPHKPVMMVFERISDDPKRKTVACVGKGVTFDAGGIMIKPSNAMMDMKMDMSGAAAVIATMQHLDGLDNLPYNVVAAIALTENMTGGDAFKPLDILRAYNGTTVEVHHTDAEGRLVLADAMAYIAKVYKPASMITIATLTGACVNALGHDYAGIMGDDESMIRRILTGEGCENFWRLPLDRRMREAVRGDTADINNLSKEFSA